jgi:hypothetical protein
MNKLDSFNKDKRKCKKCKNYCDKKPLNFLLSDKLCEYCTAKWRIFKDSWYSRYFTLGTSLDIRKAFEDWCDSESDCFKEYLNEKQT